MNRPAAWWKKAVIYELYVDKFAGNFTGLTEKLDYFNYLGVDTLWILPHYPSPLIDGGYDIADYHSIRPDLGNLEDFDRFIAAAHERGLKVVTDIVLNHTSDQHEWFRQARSSRDNPKRDWFIFSENKDKFRDAFVHFSQVKDSNWIRNEETNDYYYATFYPQQPDLNWNNPEVLSAMLSMMEFWLDRGVDGFRLDAIARLIKRDGTSCFALPETHEVLKKIRSHIDSKYENVLLMAESGGWIHEAKPFFGEGNECQMVINFPLAVQMLSAVQSKNTWGVEDIWNQSGGLPDNCSWAVFLTNHDSVDLFFLNNDDQKNQLARAIDPQGIFIQPDSQSFGARLAQVCQGNRDDIVWATKLQFSQPGTPIIYYGNELGMKNADLPEKPTDTRLYVRGNFDWNEVQNQRSDPESLLNSVREVIQGKINSQ